MSTINKLEAIGKIISYKAGDYVFYENDLSEDLYIILKGHVAIERESFLEKEATLLATLQPGSIFGEMALLSKHPRSASVKAVEDLTVLSISERHFEDFISIEPKYAIGLLSNLKMRQQDMKQRLEEVAKDTLEMEKLDEEGLKILCEKAPLEMIRLLKRLSDDIRHLNDLYLMKKESLKETLSPYLESIHFLENDGEMALESLPKYPYLLPEAHTEKLYDLQKTCPICGESFKTKALKYTQMKSLGTDVDLRTRFEGIDEIWYALMMCPNCKYTHYASGFDRLNPAYREKLSKKLLELHLPNMPHIKSSYYDVLMQYGVFLKLLPHIGNSSMLHAKTWQALMWLFEDVKDEAAMLKAKPLYHKHLAQAWANASDSMEAESEGMLTYKLAHMTLESGDIKKSYDLFYKALRIKGISSILKKKIEGRLQEISETRRNH